MLVHSMYDETMYAERCLSFGAKGYVMKREPPEKLVDAARRVLAGEVCFSEAVAKLLVSRMSGGSKKDAALSPRQLSHREFQIFELLGQGHGTMEIARTLNLSEKTIQTHRERIKKKLKIPDALNLIREAVRWAEAQR